LTLGILVASVLLNVLLIIELSFRRRDKDTLTRVLENERERLGAIEPWPEELALGLQKLENRFRASLLGGLLSPR